MSRGAGEALRPGWELRVLPALLYLAVAFVTGSLPLARLGPVDFDAADKVIHLLGFGLMQWTHARALRFMYPDWSEGKVLVASFGSSTLAGGLLEAWQFLLPHRSADLLDWVADGLGALLAACLGRLGRRGAAS